MAIEPQTSGRGYLHFDPIKSVSGYPFAIRVYESSAGGEPRIWITTEGLSSDTAVHLSLDDARQLRDQIDYLIENHRGAR